MSDDQYGQGQPGGYAPQGGMQPPPPPPPGLYPDQPAPQPAQPQYSPPPAYAHPAPQQAYAAQPPQPARKKGGLKIVLLVAGALFLCALASCAGVAFLGVSANADQEKAVKQAETHYAAAESALEKANAAAKGADSKDAAGTQRATSEADAALRQGRDEIAAAKAAIEPLDDSPGKKDYLASLAAATEALDGLQDLLGWVDTATGMGAKIADAGAAAGKANDALNAAISAGNSKDYAAMKSKAQAASADYVRAATLFSEAAKADKSAGLDKAVAYLNKRKQQADVVAQMGDDGRRGRVSAYNKGIDRMNALGKEAEKIGDPAIVKDPDWTDKRLGDLDKRVTQAAEKADSLRKKALEELGVSP